MQVHAHRKNTLAEILPAIEAGADAVELDVALRGDGVVVLSHDPIEDDGRGLPTLADALRLGAPAYNLEIKSYPEHPWAASPEVLTRAVFEHIRGVDEGCVMVQSFDVRVLRVMRAVAPGIRLSVLFAGDERPFAEVAGFTEIVGPEFHLVTREKVAAAHAAGLLVIPWTANEREDWEGLIAAGVDGIITDDAGRLRRYLGRR